MGSGQVLIVTHEPEAAKERRTAPSRWTQVTSPRSKPVGDEAVVASALPCPTGLHC